MARTRRHGENHADNPILRERPLPRQDRLRHWRRQRHQSWRGEELAAFGASIAICGRTQEKLDAAAEELRALGATAVRIGREIAIAVGLALSQAAVAAPPDSPDPALAPWFESLKQPGTGAPCCSIADCRTVEFRQDRDGYEVLIDSRWKMSNPFWMRVPPNRIIDESTTQRTAAWFASRLRLAFYVSCVRPRVNRQCRRSPSRIAWEHSHAAIEERFWKPKGREFNPLSRRHEIKYLAYILGCPRVPPENPSPSRRVLRAASRSACFRCCSGVVSGVAARPPVSGTAGPVIGMRHVERAGRKSSF